MLFRLMKRFRLTDGLIGRTIIRAVSADPDYTSSKISWVSADGTTAGSVVVARGQYQQITNPLASQAMKVECEHRCLVMAYITGTVVIFFFEYDSTSVRAYGEANDIATGTQCDKQCRERIQDDQLPLTKRATRCVLK